MTFCKPLYHRKGKRRGVGGQKKPNLVNVVCERPLRAKVHLSLAHHYFKVSFDTDHMHIHCVECFLFHDFCCSSKSKCIFFSFFPFYIFFCSRQHFAYPNHPPCQQTSAFGHPQSSTHLFADVINGWYLYQKLKLHCTHSSSFINHFFRLNHLMMNLETMM